MFWGFLKQEKKDQYQVLSRGSEHKMLYTIQSNVQKCKEGRVLWVPEWQNFSLWSNSIPVPQGSSSARLTAGIPHSSLNCPVWAKPGPRLFKQNPSPLTAEPLSTSDQCPSSLTPTLSHWCCGLRPEFSSSGWLSQNPRDSWCFLFSHFHPPSPLALRLWTPLPRLYSDPTTTAAALNKLCLTIP